MITDLRIKILRFFRKNKIAVFLGISAFIVMIIVNYYLKNHEFETEPITTYKPHSSVMDSSKSVSEKNANIFEKMIEEYIGYCNDADYASAYNMLSEQCKSHEFDNSLENFMSYVYTKMPTEKKYAIQNYSNDSGVYIYQIKFMDDFLATGLTNSTYSYTEEKIVFKKINKEWQMSVGNIVDYKDIKNIFENEYIKVDVKSVTKYYSIEEYEVKLTNRSNYIIVLADNSVREEITLILKSGDKRVRSDLDQVVLQPGKSITIYPRFSKFYDNNDNAKSLNFDSIRVMEKYSGRENVSNEIIKEEEQNAISKFSVSIPLATD